MAQLCLMPGVLTAQVAGHPSTAWRNSRFHIDVPRVVAQSDVILARPNLLPGQAMPLGNGRLGVAVWSANGLTIQLNRVDTLPYRSSPGQVVIPGLAALTRARDYSGRLDLYNGEFVEHGAGITATVYTQPRTCTLVIDVTGVKPGAPETAELKLWPPRTPHASVAGATGMLAQNWIDNQQPGASNRPFGSLAAITAQGNDVTAAVTGPRAVTVSLRADHNGHFRILITAPHYNGTENATALATRALANTAAATHRLWWHNFWQHTALIRVRSADGSGQYMENLRDIYLFSSAAENASEYPGSQAGVADLFSAAKDAHQWDPAAFWHWNLRMQVAANLGSGNPQLNAPYFNLYRSALPTIEQWTARHMHSLPGACVPETMRFNGPGIEYETWGKPSTELDCAADFHPYYNARTLSTGAEVSLWIWQQYLATNNRSFLAQNYPVMAASARFLMAYEKRGPDGLLHTSPSNAHETQWDVVDPTTDIAARMALYPAVIQAAQILHRDSDLVAKLQKELTHIPPLPRTQPSGTLTLLPPSADAQGNDVIADSYLPAAKNHNVENIGLEPVWPYDLIGEDSPLLPLARRTFSHRPYPVTADWSFDPIQAARLGLGPQVAQTLVDLTKRYQTYVNGFANWGGASGEFYVEQSGVVADALQEALVQDYDGILHIAPAVPPGWDMDGSVYVRGNTKVDVQTLNGRPTTVVIESGSNAALRVANPWSGRALQVIDAASGKSLPTTTEHAIVSFAATIGHNYLLEPSGAAPLPFAAITAAPATQARKLGPVQIGLEPAK
jgi:Glycosyl hydrolase family 95 catalytic domain